MYFYNDVPLARTKLATISSGLSMPVAKKKIHCAGNCKQFGATECL